MVDSPNASVRPQNTGTEGPALEMLYVVLVYVLLEDKGFRFNNPCVGVLLRPNLVLTTVSCVEVALHGVIDTELIVVYVRNSQVLRPVRVFVYPGTTEAPNVALILCETSSVQEFPELPEKEFTLSDFEYCTLCGFGTEKGWNGIKLMEDFTSSRINSSDMEICNRHGQRKEWLCLHFSDNMPCRGDVGAPLVCGGAVSAIFNPRVAAWTTPTCLDTYGAAFTPLYTLVPWIRKVNNTLESSTLSALNTPWTRVVAAVTGLTLIVAIYSAIMKYVDWRWARLEGQTDGENEPQALHTRSSSNSSRSTIFSWRFPPK